MLEFLAWIGAELLLVSRPRLAILLLALALLPAAVFGLLQGSELRGPLTALSVLATLAAGLPWVLAGRPRDDDRGPQRKRDAPSGNHGRPHPRQGP